MTIEVYKQIMWVHWKILFFRGGGGEGRAGSWKNKYRDLGEFLKKGEKGFDSLQI